MFSVSQSHFLLYAQFGALSVNLSLCGRNDVLNASKGPQRAPLRSTETIIGKRILRSGVLKSHTQTLFANSKPGLLHDLLVVQAATFPQAR